MRFVFLGDTKGLLPKRFFSLETICLCWSVNALELLAGTGTIDCLVPGK